MCLINLKDGKKGGKKDYETGEINKNQIIKW